MRDFIPRKIDINGSIAAVTVKQFDNDSRYIHVTISDEDLSDGTFDLLGCSAALYIQPQNNDDPTNVSFVAGEIADAENGIVTFLLPGGVTQNAGQYECEIWIYEGDSQSRPVISTKPFLLIVEKSIRNTSAVEASQSFSELDRALIEVQSVRNEVNALAALADSGEIPAGTLESEVVDARSGFSTLGAALRACVKGMNVYLNADRFRTLFGDSNYENGNFDNVGNNKIYPIGLSNGGELGNSPGVNINGTMVTFGRGDSRGNGDMQMIFTVAGSVWYRTYWDNSWTEWKRQTRFDEFITAVDGINSAIGLCVKSENTTLTSSAFRTLFGDSENSNGDFDNIGNNKIYPIGLSNGNQLANSPGTNINGLLITFGRGDSRSNGDTQMIITFGQSIYNRSYFNGAWSVWNRQVRLSEYNEFMKPWQGLKVSVLGDSISTFPNAIPSGNKCYYGTDGHASIASVNSMWWKQLCDITGATPHVIEAWSGSCCADPRYNSSDEIISGREDCPSALAMSYKSGNQEITLGSPRCQNLHTCSGSGVVNPDIIIVALGCNDYFYNVPLGSWDGHTALDSTDTKTWRGAYANMLIKIHEQYPDALVLCFSPWFCVRGWNGHNIPSATVNINGNGSTYQDYEDAMREICELMGCVYIDVNNFGFTRQNYGLYFADDINAQTNAVTHPNATGQEVLGQSIAAEVISKAKGYVNWLRR